MSRGQSSGNSRSIYHINRYLRKWSKQKGYSPGREQFNLDLRKVVQILLYLFGPPLSLLQTRATLEQTLCIKEREKKRKKMARLGEILSHLGWIKKANLLLQPFLPPRKAPPSPRSAVWNLDIRMSIWRCDAHCIKRKYSPNLKESLGKIFRKYQDLFCF